MKLLIDAGNSRVKWATLFSGVLSSQQAVVHNGDALAHCERLIQAHSGNPVVLVHVLGKAFEDKLKRVAQSHNIKLLIVHSKSQAYGIRTHYVQASTLGSDRFVAMLAAHMYYEKQACLVVDCGTAITVDAIDSTGKHCGGIIFSGLQLCEDSLINRAYNLQQLKRQIESATLDLFASSTSQGIKSGCHYGIASAIDGICQRLAQKMSDTRSVKKIICGGDARTLHDLLEDDYEQYDDLVIHGLRLIADGSLLK